MLQSISQKQKNANYTIKAALVQAVRSNRAFLPAQIIAALATSMRTQTHIVDSRAVKAVMAHMPHHWVVRELTERDYGIDLMVEIFAPGLKDAKGKDAFAATGSVFHIQIKGTEDALKPVRAGTINYCINKSSLSYVEKFSIPFFLFHVSVADPQKIYFLWIQRYIKDVMDRETPTWREDKEDSITVRIPPENKLPAESINLKELHFDRSTWRSLPSSPRYTGILETELELFALACTTSTRM